MNGLRDSYWALYSSMWIDLPVLKRHWNHFAWNVYIPHPVLRMPLNGELLSYSVVCVQIWQHGHNV